MPKLPPSLLLLLALLLALLLLLLDALELLMLPPAPAPRGSSEPITEVTGAMPSSETCVVPPN